MLVSAITIPHMLDLLVQHGLVPVPLDLDPSTLDVVALPEPPGPRVRAILVAHLFGARMDLAPLSAFARRHGLLLWEDCAQIYRGDLSEGHPDSDVVFFSFGSIKTATALGGALTFVRSPELLEEMRRREALYPPMPEGRFVGKVLRSAVLKLFSDGPRRYGSFVRLCRALGKDHDALVMTATRGFPGADWIAKLRYRLSRGQQALLSRRLSEDVHPHVEARRKAGEALRDALSLPPERIPGSGARDHTFWLFPVLVDDPEGVRRRLQEAGFDGALARSSLSVAPGRPPAVRAEATLRQILYLPLDGEMSQTTLRSLSEAFKQEPHGNLPDGSPPGPPSRPPGTGEVGPPDLATVPGDVPLVRRGDAD